MKKAKYILDQEFIKRLKFIIDPKQLDLVLNSFEIEKPTSIRVNTLKSTIKAVLNSLNQNQIEYETVPWSEISFILPNISHSQLINLAEYKAGLFYVQSLSSIIPALVLDPQPEDKILDMCAAPGSKTSQLAALMENHGSITANDNSGIRLQKLMANLRNLGVTNTVVFHSHGQSIWQKYPEYFDKTLVDAPCSMEGRFNINDEKSYNFWSIAKIRELVEVQKWLLRSAISTTKVGGTIVYSTCTLAPEENEGIVDWILKKEVGSVILEDIKIANLPISPSLNSWNNKIFSETINRTIRILPSENYEGFYVAKFKKITTNLKKD
jgi:tRNA (cytosine49-C5)-methyltransferase